MVAIRWPLIALAILLSFVVATCFETTKPPPIVRPLDTPNVKGGGSVGDEVHNYGLGGGYGGLGQGPYGEVYVYGPSCVCPGNINWPGRNYGTPASRGNPSFVVGPGGGYEGIGRGSYVEGSPVYDYRTGCACLGHIYWPGNGYVNRGFGGNPNYGVGPGGSIGNTPVYGFVPSRGIRNIPVNRFVPGGGIGNTHGYVYAHGGGGSGVSGGTPGNVHGQGGEGSVLGGGTPSNGYGHGGGTPGHEGFHMHMKEAGEVKSSSSPVKSTANEEAMAPGLA